MKVLKYFLAFCAVLCIFFLGLLMFAPWQTIGIYGLDTFRLNAAEKSIYVYYDHFEANGGFSPAYRMRSLDIETPMAHVSLSNITVNILPFSSVFSLGGVCQVGFTGGTITLVPNNKLELSAGGATLTAGRETFHASDVQITGDLQLSGDMAYNLQTKKMIDSSITFTVPEQLDAILRNPITARFIESNENGEWRIRYDAQDR